jgi:hypothetical protein
MSFTGDLEHLPVVDVIQLLHSTRKSGTLALKSPKGESQLVFDEGYITSANHSNNRMRIGHILTQMKVITPAQIEEALEEQKRAGADRKPLVATLIETGRIRKEDAFKGLGILIEMTIVEVLTWTTGTFALEIGKTSLSDEYRYFPDNLQQSIHMDTQGVLMDALRIFDEKTRDGSLKEGAFPAEQGSPPPAAGGAPEGPESPEISADILGLGDVEKIEKKVPSVFIGFKDYDPSEVHRKAIREGLGELSPPEHEKLLAFLMQFGKTPPPAPGAAQRAGSAPSVIVFGRDEFFKHAVATICKPEGIFVTTMDDEASIDMMVEQSLMKGQPTALVTPPPEGAEGAFSAEGMLAVLAGKQAKYPRLALLPLAGPGDREYTLRALQLGARAVLPAPAKAAPKDAVADEEIRFLETVRGYLRAFFAAEADLVEERFQEGVVALGGLATAPEISFVLLRFAADMFERSVTFIVGRGELIAERGFGVKADRKTGPTEPLRFRVPLGQPSVFREAIEKGTPFYGQSTDAVLAKHVFPEIGAPLTPKILLLPLRSLGKVIGLIYADFGATTGSLVRLDLLDLLARYASLALENATLRKRFEKPPASG